jgi:hypothetical protein
LDIQKPISGALLNMVARGGPIPDKSALPFWTPQAPRRGDERSEEKVSGLFLDSRSSGSLAREALIYSMNGYNTGHHLKLHGERLNAPTNARW